MEKTSANVQAEIIAWISQEMARTKKTRTDIGRALKLAPSGVTRLMNGERNISLEDLIRLSYLFGNPEGYLQLLMSFWPGYRLERRGQPPQFASVEDHVAAARSAMEAAVQRQRLNAPLLMFQTSPGDGDTYDLMVENTVSSKIQRPAGLANVADLLCVRVKGKKLEPRFDDGDPAFLIQANENDFEALIFFEIERPENDGRRPFLIGHVVGASPDTGHLTIRSVVSGREKVLDPERLKGIYRAASSREVFGLPE